MKLQQLGENNKAKSAFRNEDKQMLAYFQWNEDECKKEKKKIIPSAKYLACQIQDFLFPSVYCTVILGKTATKEN